MSDLELYLDHTMGMLTVVGGRYMILLPYDYPIEADSFEELMETVTYTVNEWRKIDEQRNECH